jgi:3-methyladenine DNA glycosylase AlkD
MKTVEDVLEMLSVAADEDRLEGMRRYGISVDKRMGVKVPEMRKIAKQIGRDHELALDLWQTGIAEAMIVASMVDEAVEVTEAQMDEWVNDFNSWDVCDQVCMNLFEKTPFAWAKIHEWAKREPEFVKRAAFALIACLAWHDKSAPDEKFIELIPVIHDGATDERNFVKKAVSWALRNIGKRNRNLNLIALAAAEKLKASESKSARWIGSDTVRDITSQAAQRRLAKTDS